MSDSSISPDPTIKDIYNLLSEQVEISRAILSELKKKTEDENEEKWNPYKWPHNDGLS